MGHNAGTGKGSTAPPGLLLPGLAVLVSVAVFAGAFAYVDGASLIGKYLGDDVTRTVAGWFGGGAQPTEARRPRRPASQTPPLEEDLRLPAGLSRDDALLMYAEQLESNQQIRDLVDDHFAWFELGEGSRDEASAELVATGHYRTGSKLVGHVSFRKYGRAWFFTSIKRSGIGSDEGMQDDERLLDYGVANTIVEEQIEYQDLMVPMVDLQWRRLDILGVRRGPDTAAVKGKLSGGDAADQLIEIVCIKKTLGGTDYWFITGCRKV